MADDAAIMVYQQVAKEQGDTVHFDLKKLLQLPNFESYLFKWLKEFGFTAWEDIYDLAESQTGKKVFSDTHLLLKNRNFLILSPINQSDKEEEYVIAKNQTDVNFPLKLSFCKADDISNLSNTTIFVDADKLQFPLILRKWKEGDSFSPFGMNGKTKKVSKFFKDEKLSLIEKETTWLLCSDNQIVWIVGIRQDERFKIENTTQNILKIAIL